MTPALAQRAKWLFATRARSTADAEDSPRVALPSAPAPSFASDDEDELILVPETEEPVPTVTEESVNRLVVDRAAQLARARSTASLGIPRQAVPSSVPEPAIARRSARVVLAEVMEKVAAECRHLVWPMFRFTLEVGTQDGRFTASRHDPEEWSPAIGCAVEILAVARFDDADLTETERFIPFELLGPGARAEDIAGYRAMLAREAQGLRYLTRAKHAPLVDTSIALYGAAQAEYIRAGRQAELLAGSVVARKGVLNRWQVHYADAAKHAVLAFTYADQAKRAVIDARPARQNFTDCSRDLHDAWRIAHSAVAVLRDSDYGRFFEMKERAFSQYSEREHCRVE